MTRFVVKSDSFLPTRDSEGIRTSSSSSSIYNSSFFFFSAAFAFLYNFTIRISLISRMIRITRDVRVPAREALPAL